MHNIFLCLLIAHHSRNEPPRANNVTDAPFRMIQTSDIRDALLDECGRGGEFQVQAGNGAKKKASTDIMSEDFDGGIKKRIIESDRARGSRQEKISEWLQVVGGS